MLLDKAQFERCLPAENRFGFVTRAKRAWATQSFALYGPELYLKGCTRARSFKHHHLANRLTFVQQVEALVDLIELEAPSQQLVHRKAAL
jgi:hypothetical protein